MISTVSLQTIAAHLWQSTLFAAAAGVVTLGLRKNRARTRYWVWLAAVMKFLVPFGVLVSLGGLFSVPRFGAKAPAIVEPAISFVMGDVAQPVLRAAVASPQSGRDHLTAVLVGVWACGFLAIVFCWGRRWTRIHADVRAGSRVSMEIGIPVVSSPVLREPGVFGIFRPVLLLPEGMAEHLSRDEWDAVLAHELCHVRCYDNLTAAVYMLVETIFWFHPGVWWIGKRLVAERERACDEEVLRLGNAPGVYAEGILKVCERYLESPLECVAGVTGSNLRRRIRAIMTHRGTEGMTMGKKLLLAAAASVAIVTPIAVGLLKAQQPPAFEVVSIKPVAFPSDAFFAGYTDASSCGEGMVKISGSRLTLPITSLCGMIRWAYGVRAYQIASMPAWMEKKDKANYYEVEAKAPGDAPLSEDRAREMLRATLADRFQFKFHREIKEFPVYALVVGKNGPKVSTQPICKPLDVNQLKAQVENGRITGIGVTACNPTETMPRLAEYLSDHVDRPVVDKTGLTEKYAFQLRFARDGAPGAVDSAPDLFTAIQEQVGLKLDPRKLPIDVLVIDHAEMPSAN